MPRDGSARQQYARVKVLIVHAIKHEVTINYLTCHSI